MAWFYGTMGILWGIFAFYVIMKQCRESNRQQMIYWSPNDNFYNNNQKTEEYPIKDTKNFSTSQIIEAPFLFTEKDKQEILAQLPKDDDDVEYIPEDILENERYIQEMQRENEELEKRYFSGF